MSASEVRGSPGDTGQPDAPTDLVRAFWAAYQARDWAGAQSLMTPQACCTWWTTRERFVGAAAIVHVNAVYPEGWTIHLLAVEALGGGRALSLVRVDHGEASHYSHAWFAFTEAGPQTPVKISAIEEFWAADEAPPAWRDALPGKERTGGVCTDRPAWAA